MTEGVNSIPYLTEILLIYALMLTVDFIVLIRTWRAKLRYSRIVSCIVASAIAIMIAYAGSVLATGYRSSSLCSSLTFIGIDAVLISLFLFVRQFTGFHTETRHVRTVEKLMAVWVVLDVVCLLINPFHEIALTYTPVRVGGLTVYRYVPYLPFSLHLAFSYLLIVLIIIMLVYKAVHVASVYRQRYLVLLGLVLFDILLNALFLLGANDIVLDVSVMFYSVTIVALYLCVFAFLPRSLLNTMRIYVVENIEWPLIVFDPDNNVLDCNQSAVKLFPDLLSDFARTHEAPGAEEYFLSRGFPASDEHRTNYEWTRNWNGEVQTFLCEHHDFSDRHNHYMGWMLTMRDISYSVDTVTGFELTPGLHRYLGNMNRSANYPISVVSFNITGLGAINHALGHNKGNLVMSRTAHIIQEVLGRETYMAKQEDGTMTGILLKTDQAAAQAVAEEIVSIVRRETSLGFAFALEYGVVEVNEASPDIFEALQEASHILKNRKMLSGASKESALVSSLTQTLLESDYETEAHVNRTRAASRRIASILQLSDRETSELALLCMLHDVGKVGIPSEILLKPGKLDDDEWEIMKSHTEKGYRIAMASPDLAPIAKLILHHHERWDGNGYPGHMKGEEIPLLDRIITVLDAFDVMTHDRPYHHAIDVLQAKQELLNCSGHQFDPRIVDAFLTVADEVYAMGETDTETAGGIDQYLNKNR